LGLKTIDDLKKQRDDIQGNSYIKQADKPTMAKELGMTITEIKNLINESATRELTPQELQVVFSGKPTPPPGGEIGDILPRTGTEFQPVMPTTEQEMAPVSPTAPEGEIPAQDAVGVLAGMVMERAKTAGVDMRIEEAMVIAKRLIGQSAITSASRAF